MRQLKEGVREAEVEISTIVRRQVALSFPITEFPELEQLKSEIRPVL